MLDQSGRASYNRASDGMDYRNTEEFYNAQQMMSWVEFNMMKYEDYQEYWNHNFTLNCYLGNTISTTEALWSISFEELRSKIQILYNDDQIEMYYIEQNGEN